MFDMLCSIHFHWQERISEEHVQLFNVQCWHNLLRNPVLVKGYPILRRSEPNTGLEIPLNIMAALARALRATTFNKRLFVKGFCTMLIPNKQIGDLLI
jgi:hypothetical protein